MNIGTIRAADNGVLTGNIATLSVAMRFALRPVSSLSPKAPAFELCARNPAGATVQIGALWEQTSKATCVFRRSRPLIPTRSRPPYRFEAGHHSGLKPAI